MALEAAGAVSSSNIPMQVIDAGEILAKVQKGQPVEYDHVIVKGDLDLSRERLQNSISSPITIIDSIFEGRVSFNGSTLDKPVDVAGSNFTKNTYFQQTTFSDDAEFERTAFSRYAGFWRTTFSTNADFEFATFSGWTDFQETTFSGYASFQGTVFGGYANFQETDFCSSANFQGTAFSYYASFLWATFSNETDFEFATFSSNADFEEAAFNSNVNFGWATFSGYADFGGAAFSGYSNFWKAAFSSNSSFEDAELNGNIEFSNTRFENETSFYRILFKRPAYFENCSIKSLNLTKAEYSRLHLRWGDIKSLHFDEAAYLALIKNYNTLGWYGDANRCYYDYRNAVRRSWQDASSPGFAAKVSSPLDRLVDFGEWLLYGYGVRPSFPVAWCIGIILAFGLFFRQKKCLRKIITEERIEDAEDGSDEVLVESKARKAPLNFIDPFLFSLFTFTSGFTAFLHPAVEYKLERCLRWAIAERLLGPFLLALVITTISKTYLIR